MNRKQKMAQNLHTQMQRKAGKEREREELPFVQEYPFLFLAE